MTTADDVGSDTHSVESIAMARVATVIISSLLFALLGLAIGHLCVDTIRVTSQQNKMHEDYVLICYMVPPAVGAVLGFIISLVALRCAGAARPLVIGDSRP